MYIPITNGVENPQIAFSDFVNVKTKTQYLPYLTSGLFRLLRSLFVIGTVAESAGA